jgi:hypothetical protein
MSDVTSRGALTRCQQRWLEHLRACEAQGCSLKHYALEHGLSAQAAYVAKSALKRRGAWPVSPPSISLTLVPVTVSRPPRADATVVRIRLPNGAVIEVLESAHSELIEMALNAVSRVAR